MSTVRGMRRLWPLRSVSLGCLLSLLGWLSGCATPTTQELENQPAQPLLAGMDCHCQPGQSWSGLSTGVANPLFSLDAVLFDTARATLRPAAQPVLESIVTAIQFHRPNSVIIEGSADSRGGTAYNQDLSQRRATAVKQALIARGISAALLQTQGYGEQRPVASNNNAAGMQQNRRVDVTLNLN